LIMRKLIIAVLVIISLESFAQPTNYTWYKQRIRQHSLMLDSMLYIPRYNGTPSGVRANENSAIDGAIAVDTANGRQYFYYNGSWRRLANYSELGVDSIWREAGKDSIFWSKAGNTYKIKDSTGGGSTPTLQQVLTAGSTLTVSNSIDAGGFNFNLRQVDTLSNAATIKEDSLTRYIMVTPNYESSFRIRDNGVDALIVDIGDVEDSGNGTNVALSDATGIIQLQAQLGGVILDGGYTKILNLANATTQDVLIGQTNIGDELGYITIGSGLSLSSGVLSASGGGGGSSGITVGTTTITSGTNTRVGFNDGGVYGEDAGLAYDKTTDILSIGVAANVPTIYGGTGTTSDLNLKTTTGVGTTGADMHFLVGNNGGTEAMTILNSGAIGFNSNSPVSKYNFYLPIGTAPSTTWTTDHFVIGEPGGTGAGLGIMRHNGTGAVRLYSVAPNVAWNPLEFYFSSSAFYGSGSNLGISIAATGNVGIKTTTSTDALNISGSLSMISGRHKTAQGADVASAAGAITLGSDGNVFEITGTNSITAIVNTSWQNGATITLLFTSTATLTDGTANSGTSIGFELAGNANFTASADDVITLVLSEIGGTQRWREVSRSVN
jgi:hypothetical protein